MKLQKSFLYSDESCCHVALHSATESHDISTIRKAPEDAATAAEAALLPAAAAAEERPTLSAIAETADAAAAAADAAADALEEPWPPAHIIRKL